MGLMTIFERMLGKRRLNRPKAIRLETPRPSKFPMAMTEDNLVTCFNEQVCISCGAEDMIYNGPCGGASQNFACGCCGQRTNMLVIQGKAMWGQDIGVEDAIRDQYMIENKSIRDRMEAKAA